LCSSGNFCLDLFEVVLEHGEVFLDSGWLVHGCFRGWSVL
jgi:hypothetical protein